MPKQVFLLYHWFLAIVGALVFWFPSERLFVIGITGTTGKSTTALMLARILEEAGYMVGMASTIFFKIGKEEKLNDKKMTMLGRFALQRLLRKMLTKKCHIAIVETTSEGIVQYRHAGINYDTVLFTNLFPEHLESHGSFENYKKAKGKLFYHLAEGRRKKLSMFGKKKIPKTIIVNFDNEHAKYFLSFKADRAYGFRIKGKKEYDFTFGKCKNIVADKIKMHSVSLKDSYLEFSIGNIDFRVPILGKHNVYNALAAITTALSVGVDLEVARAALEKFNQIPGRLERLDEGQDFDVIVDYAFEPKAFEALYQTIFAMQEKPKRIIHVAGQTGGGRDVARREPTGEFIAKHADIFIVTDEDPYDEDPMDIINAVVRGAKKGGMNENENLFIMLDRREAIKKAINLAQKDDLVLITGKGSEQAMVVRGKLVPWDDRKVVREELKRLTK